jgi:hypothetical protein
MALARQIRAGSAFIEVSLKNNIERGLANLSKSLSSVGTRITAVGAGLAGVGTAATTAFGSFTKEFASFGATLDDVSQRIGVGVRALSSLQFATEQSGGSLADLQTGLRQMQRTLADASDEGSAAAQALADIGLSASHLLGLSTDEQFRQIADGIASIGDPALRNARAMDIFGRAALNLVPLLAEGSAGIQALQDRAAELGLVLDEQAAASAARLDDAISVLRATFRAARISIGEAFASGIANAAERMTELVSSGVSFIRNNQELVRTIGLTTVGVTAAGVAIAGLGTAFIGAGVGLSSLVTIGSAAVATFGTIASAIAAIGAPVAALTVGLAVLGASMVDWSDVAERATSSASTAFRQLQEDIGGIATALTSALSAGDIGLAMRVLTAGLRLEWQRTINALIRITDQWKQHTFEVFNDLTFGLAGVAAKLLPATGRFIGRTLEREFTRLGDNLTTLAQEARLVQEALLDPSKISQLPQALRKAEQDFRQLRRDRAQAERAQELGLIDEKERREKAALSRLQFFQRRFDEARRAAEQAAEQAAERRAEAEERRVDEMANKIGELQRKGERVLDFAALRTAEIDRTITDGQQEFLDLSGQFGRDFFRDIAATVQDTLTRVQGTFVGALASRSLGFVSPEDRQLTELRKLNKKQDELIDVTRDNKLELVF